MHEAQRLFKLAVVGLATACRTMQLVDARNGSPRPATDVIDAASLVCGRSHWRDAGGQDRTPEKPPSAAFSGLVGLDHCQTWWLELLLLTAWPREHLRAGWGQFESMAAGFTVATTFEPPI